ncbi:hypothetical protein EMPS_01795 [Entomortierella parvispora]|uniref:LysM domain-containing protein n=1 Tax=Entomortierella parvispora TaxID=205924 RepID=A0A9P3H3J5_9FUNG|nr:hypothetical protein EMPS_01795 [Entomortierella parvispora]
MKFSATLLVLAAVASQAMAVIPIPVKGCQKTVVVKSTDTGCVQFATDNHITFKQLLAWNEKLRTDCANLDVGAPLCVAGPSTKPQPKPTQKPEPKPTQKPKPKPTQKPKPKPTQKPKPKPTQKPKPKPTQKPKPKPTSKPHAKTTSKPKPKATPNRL